MRQIAYEESVQQVVDILLQGGIIVYPTETVYGLGCLADNNKAILRIAALKGSSPSAPYLVLIKDKRQLVQFCGSVPAIANQLADHFWPGPLTLVVPAREGLHTRLVGPSGGVALRHSSHPWLGKLLWQLPSGLISTSANSSGREPISDLGDLEAELSREVDLIVDAGRLSGGVSTVLDLCRKPLMLIREGVIPFSAIKDFVTD